jgi:muconolactone delta-isomerase
MKYLVTSKVKDVFYMLPDEQRMVIMGAAMAYGEKLRKEGKIREMHVMPGWNRTMFIADVENHEEASRMSLENPLYSYSDIETYGLVEWDTWKKQMERAYQQLAVKK